MDAELARTEAELLGWGLLEPGPPLAWSRRLRGAVMRAAAGLQEAEATGRAPAGHPVLVALAAALEQSFPDLRVTPRHHAFLAAVELAALPAAVRDLLGLGA
jgi:hypothetical protein